MQKKKKFSAFYSRVFLNKVDKGKIFNDNYEENLIN